MSISKTNVGVRVRGRREIALDAVTLIGFFLLALWMTRPLIGGIFDSVAGRIGDNIYFVWLVGWFKKAYFSLGVDPMRVWFLNYPAGWNLASTEIAPAQLALAVPFALLGGETFGYNAALLLSFALSGWFVYRWISSWTGSRCAGWVAGVIFACLPYRQAHFLAGHLNLAGTQWLPLFFWGWIDLLRREDGDPRVHVRAAITAAVGLGLTALSSQYYVFMTLFIGAILFLGAMIWNRRLLTSTPFWKSLLIMGLTALPLLVIAEAPFLMLDASGAMPNRDISSVRQYSASISDFLLPATTHFLFGGRVGATFNRDLWIESSLYLGYIALALFFVGYFLRRSSGSNRLIWRFLVLGVISSVILAMGTDLHWNERAVELALPRFIADRLGQETFPVLLPGYFLFKYFPFFAKIRAMMRFGIFSGLLLAAAAGLGSAALLTRLKAMKKSVRQLCFIALLALILLEYAPRALPETAVIAPRPADRFLAAQPDTGAVMRLPFYLNDDQAGTYYTLTHEKPFVGGFFNAFPTAQYREIKPIFDSFPSEAGIALARELGVRYFLIEADLDRPAETREAERLTLLERCLEADLQQLYEADGVTILTYGDGK